MTLPGPGANVRNPGRPVADLRSVASDRLAPWRSCLPNARALANSRRIVPLLGALLLACTPQGTATPAATPGLAAADFAALSSRLSEAGGYFPSDNLVSNETSYLHVVPALHAYGVAGGAYVGVGPDQSFSYIAEVRPEIVFMIDIRRDNLLHHLLFKALFQNARNRLEYLCLLFGKPPPRHLEPWDDADIGALVTYIDSVQATVRLFEDAADRVADAVRGYAMRLSDDDLATIRAIHRAFVYQGLDIRYSNRGRFSWFPTYRQLLLETDLDGVHRNYLSSEERFRFLKDLEQRNLIIPVVGDLAGPHALAAVGREIADRGLHVSVFYTSNVEQYLMQGYTFDAFAETVAGLPFDEHSVIIRSYFNRGWLHPATVSGHRSVQLVEPIRSFVEDFRRGGLRSYYDVVGRSTLPMRRAG